VINSPLELTYFDQNTMLENKNAGVKGSRVQGFE